MNKFFASVLFACLLIAGNHRTVEAEERPIATEHSLIATYTEGGEPLATPLRWVIASLVFIMTVPASIWPKSYQNPDTNRS